MDKLERIYLLEKEIKKHNKMYWEEGQPVIPDTRYDKLTEELKSLDPTNPILTKIHTPKIESGKKVKHKTPMLSLNKVYSYEDLIAWCRKVARNEQEEFCIQPKYDGCSGEATDSGLSTRGDGTWGEDVTDKLPIFYPLTYKNIPRNVSIRGEILFRKSIFKVVKNDLKSKSGEPYKNERAATAGLLNRDDVDPSHGQLLTFVPFSSLLKVCKFKNMTKELIDTFAKKVENHDFPADGIVIKLNDCSYGESLGSTSHHKRSEIALKFTNPTGETTLLGITWSLGKEAITPIGNVAPVEISGVTIKNVNLHNFNYLIENDIRVGDTLVIERAGDVIPDVKEVIKAHYSKRKPLGIVSCPSCGTAAALIDPQLICPNRNCEGKKFNKLMDSVRRIGIERLGPPTLQKMMDTLGVKDLADIFELTKEQIESLDGFGDRSAEIVHNEIQKVKTEGVYEWQILAALNIEGIGRSMSKKLLSDRTFKELILMSNFQSIEGIGPERERELSKGLIDNTILLIKLSVMLKIKSDSIADVRPTICFTGKFPEKKAHYYEIAGSLGYDVVERVSNGLSLLVVADFANQSSKQKAAEKLGIKMIEIDELI